MPFQFPADTIEGEFGENELLMPDHVLSYDLAESEVKPRILYWILRTKKRRCLDLELIDWCIYMNNIKMAGNVLVTTRGLSREFTLQRISLNYF